jgi:A/G-specific adenine glycosylase
MKTAATSSLAKKLEAWFDRNARDLPWRRSPSPYRVWISEIMLQQTQVATVVPYFERFIARFPHVKSLADADEQDVLALWSGLGYYRRARMLHAVAREIVSKHAGEFPSEREAVLALPGIGPYTAGAILSIAFNQPEPIVDGNVARVFARITREMRQIKSKHAQAAAWAWARALVRTKGAKPRALNQALMELGATVCTPAAPQCDACPVSRFCAAKELGDAAKFPRVTKKPPPRLRRYIAWLAQDKQGRVLLVKRGLGENSLLPDGLWELPQSGWVLQPTRAAAASRPLHVVRQTIMNWKVELEVRAAKHVSTPRGADARWFELNELSSLPLASITRKALALIAGAKTPLQRSGTGGPSHAYSAASTR